MYTYSPLVVVGVGAFFGVWGWFISGGFGLHVTQGVGLPSAPCSVACSPGLKPVPHTLRRVPGLPGPHVVSMAPYARCLLPFGGSARPDPPRPVPFASAKAPTPPPPCAHLPAVVPCPPAPQASLLVDQCRKLLAPSLAAYVSESYDRAYYSVVQLQLLSELEEVISFKKSGEHGEQPRSEDGSPPKKFADLNDRRNQLRHVWGCG